MKLLIYGCLCLCLMIGFIVLSGPVSASGAKPDIELKLTNPETIEIEPGKVFTMSLLALNHTNTGYNFFEQLDLPANWQLLLPAGSFVLAPNEQQVRLLTIVIPATCLAGAYHVNYSIISQDAQRHTYKSSVTVNVSSVTGVKSFIETKPSVVVAGENYSLKLRYLNTGNSPLTVSFTVKSQPAYSVEFLPLALTLQPNQSEILTLNVQTGADITSNLSQTINIKAVDKTDPSLVYCDDTVITDIIPQVSGMFDRYRRIPGQLKVITGIEENSSTGSLNPELQFDFSGGGSIDDAGKNNIALHLLTPNLIGQTSTQNQAELQFTYSNELLTANIGNQSVVLSPLTQRWDNVYNINADLHLRETNFGIILPETKEDNPEQDQLGAYYHYQLNPSFGMKANFLNQSVASENNSVYSLQTEVQAAPDTFLNMEYGLSNQANLSDKANAYRVHIYKQSPNSFNYSLETIYAAPYFSGNYSDMNSTNGSVMFSINDKTQSSFSYHSYQNNLELDPAKNTAYDDVSYTGNLSYTLSPRTLLLFTLENIQKQNPLSIPGYFTDQKTVKFGVQYQLSQWNFIPSIAFGKYEDYIDSGNNSNFVFSNFIVSYSPKPEQSYLIYTNIGDASYTSIPGANNLIGASVSIRFKNNLNLNIQYQKNYLFSESTASSNYFALNLAYAFNQYSWRFNGSQSSNSESSDYNGSFQAEYTLPCKVPISKRSDLGTLKGKILDATDPDHPGLANVILRTNGISVVTNQKGEFIFEAIAPGVYSIMIDRSLIGLNMVPIEKTPLIVELGAGESKFITIGMAPAGRISGRTVILSTGQAKNSDQLFNDSENLYAIEDEKDHSNTQLNPEDLAKEQALANSMIELSDGNEIFRQVTDETGSFSFDGLRPGKWILKVYDNNLPPHYYFEKAEFVVELKSNEDREVVFKAIPQVRSIQIIDEGKL